MDIPVVVKLDTFPMNLEDKKRFKLSRWNYFLRDYKNKYVAGYWEAEEGEELLGNNEDFDEFMIILKGKLEVRYDNISEIAGPGSCIFVKGDRPVTLIVSERIEAFFFCIPMKDIESYENMVKEAMGGN